MVPEERFGRWVAIGAPLFLVFGAFASTMLHLGANISWTLLLPAAGLFVGIQVIFYMGAFWAGRLGRRKGIVWPISLLVGFYLWSTGLIVIRYGAEWKLLPSIGGSVSFSVLMALVTLLSVIISILARDKIRDLYN